MCGDKVVVAFSFLVGLGTFGFFVGFGALGFLVGFGGFGFFVGFGAFCFFALASFSAAFLALALERQIEGERAKEREIDRYRDLETYDNMDSFSQVVFINLMCRIKTLLCCFSFCNLPLCNHH